MCRNDFHHTWSLTLMAALCLSLASCGGKTPAGQLPVFEARGKVSFEGKALSGAKLFFHPESPLKGPDSNPVPTPSAYSNEAGEFVVTTYKPGDGLPAGNYQVTVACPDATGEVVGDTYPELLPPDYQNPVTSGLTASIAPGRNELSPFELNP